MDKFTTPPTASKKFFTRQILFVFLFGLILGVALFSSYGYYRLSRQNSTVDKEISYQTSPAVFDITGSDHIWGNKDATTTLVVFADLTCPYCREYYDNLKQLMVTRSEKLRIVWRHLPLSLNSVLSVSSAVATECAGEQGNFFEYCEELYANQDKFSPEFYQAVAVNLGLNSDDFATCVSSGRYENKIKADYNEGVAKGVDGAPASFLNGRYLPGTLPLSQLEILVDPLIK